MAEPFTFVTLKFEGRRFPPRQMPLEALPELAAYRQLVVAFAKALFLAENPGRQRLPKGFDSSFALVLDHIEAGSAVPVIGRIGPPTLPAASLPPDLYERARDALEETIASASANEQLPNWVGPELLAQFGLLGRTLEEDDVMVIGAERGRGAAYTRRVRQTLLRRAHASYEDVVDLVGEVRVADKDRDSFTLRLPDGRRVTVHAPALFFPLALRSIERASPVRVRGLGLFDAEGILQRVNQTTDVSLAEEGDEILARRGCTIPITEQIEGLLALPSGWFDGEGTAFERGPAERVGALLVTLVDGFRLPNPFVYPTPDGLIRAEWSRPGWEVAVEFDPHANRADAFASNLTDDEVRERSEDFTKPGAEVRLGQLLADDSRQSDSRGSRQPHPGA
jgi:hypothetical protein